MADVPLVSGSRGCSERVSQAAFDIVASDCLINFRQVRDSLLAWLEKKVGHALPPAMKEGKTAFLDDVDALRTETVALDDPLFWSFRRNDHDSNYPQRNWVTECSLARIGDKLRLGYRLHLINRGEPAPFQRSIPRFVKEIAKSFSISIDGREVDVSAYQIAFEEDIEEFIHLLQNEHRAIPVICISSYINSQNLEVYSLPADRIAASLLGTAHVFTITRK